MHLKSTDQAIIKGRQASLLEIGEALYERCKLIDKSRELSKAGKHQEAMNYAVKAQFLREFVEGYFWIIDWPKLLK